MNYTEQKGIRYEKLVDEVGKETDEKLIKLANLFTEYHFELLDLYCADPEEYYQKGYSRILNVLKNWQTNKSMIL